jgi:hypothetical protein
MLISYKKNFIFVHIKKTAGSSVTSRLSAYDDRHAWLKFLNLKTVNKIKFLRKLNPFPFHANAYEIRDYIGAAWNDFFTFAFVRNPFDWQVSNYFYIRQSRLHPRHLEVKDLNFKEYLDWTQDRKRIYLQSTSVCEKDDLSRIIVSFIGKFENIDEDFHHVLTEIGLESAGGLAKINQSKRQKDYMQYYDNECIEFIRTHYKIDLENFNYSF